MSESLIVNCEYCDREMASSQIYRHESVCIHNPENAEAAKTCLHNCAIGPFMPGLARYDREAAFFENVPRAHTIMVGLDCDWNGVARWAGLRPQSERMDFTIDELRKMSTQNHDGIIGPGAREWDTEAPAGTYGSPHLIVLYGSWVEVLEAAGLVQGTRQYYMKIIRERSKNGDIDMEQYIEDARREAQNIEKNYPLLPGTWQRKTYALWPSGAVVTSTVYALK